MRERNRRPTAATARRGPRRVADLVRGRRDLQAFLVANALWELALSALKTFVVLYVTKTLGLSLAGSSLAIGVAASAVLVGAVVSGKIADNLGRARVMRVALVIYGLGLLVPFASTSHGWWLSRRRWSPSAAESRCHCPTRC